MSWRNHPYVLLTLLAVATPAPSSRAADVEEPALATVVEQVENNLAAVHSLQVSFRSWYVEHAGTSNYEASVFAAKGPSRFAALWHGEAGEEGLDPGATRRFFDGQRFNVFQSYFGRYEVSQRFAVPPFTDKIRAHPFLENLGWWPPDDPSPPLRPNGRAYFLADLLADPRLRIKKGIHLVGTTPCRVLELTGLDKLYVDPRRGTVLRHEVYAERLPGKLLVTFELTDFRRVQETAWLPYRLRRAHHPTHLEIVTEVDRWEINQVEDDVFSFSPPPGTLIYDRDSDTYSQIPGGEEFLERVVKWVSSASRETPPRPRRLAAVLGAVSVGMGLFWGLKASRAVCRRRQAAGPRPGQGEHDASARP